MSFKCIVLINSLLPVQLQDVHLSEAANRVERTWSQEWTSNLSSTSFWESLGLFINTSGLHCFICKTLFSWPSCPILKHLHTAKGTMYPIKCYKSMDTILPAVMEKKSFILKVLRILYHYRLSAYQYKFLFFYHITFKSWTDLSSRWSVHLQWLG